MDDADEIKPKRFYAVRYEDDIPKPGKGVLIPYNQKAKSLVVRQSIVPQKFVRFAELALVPVVALLFMVTASVIGIETYANLNTASLPSVSVVNPFTAEVRPLTYGVQAAFTEPGFFADTRDAFIREEITFIDIDLSALQLRYFEDGVLVLSYPILAKGERGTLWQTPAGIYAVTAKKERHYSSFGKMYQPWNITFQENFFIHGEPEYERDVPVPAEERLGGIRLSNSAAEELYEFVHTDIPVLVYEASSKSADFLYEPKIPELDTPHYLIADVEGSTILASSDVDAVAPIASITKLMTALVAAETINLDMSVSVTQPTFVQSLIPRLGDRSRVSMYSLLQLLLVESSNEAAEVIAAQVGREVFIDRMNDKAAALGLTKTTFADPSGLAAGNTSSVGDLLRLVQYIYKNRSFILELTANADIPTVYVSGEFGDLVNFNLTDDRETFIGGKVGETLAAGQTSVSLHRLLVKGVPRVVAIVILGSDNRNEDVNKLYQYAVERFAY